MRQATLTRFETSDQGTFGELVTDSGYMCYTGELPWRDNLSGKSSIPTGLYLCTWRLSPKHGPCYHVEKVPGRTDVEIHSANFMGDKDLGFKCELLGCISPGLSVETPDKQKMILSSREALKQLENDLFCESFELTIVDSD